MLVDDPRALGLRVGDGLWLRLVDVDAALRARSYKPGASVVLEVRDELCPWNAGRYRVGDDAGRTEDTADLALDVTDLASPYLGAFDFHSLARAGLVEERVEGAARGGDDPLPHRRAALLPGGILMAWEIRPTKDLEEFGDAVGAISHYFGGRARPRARRARSRRNLPLERMHAAFDGDRIVGGAGAFPFELTVPGGTGRRAAASPSSASSRRTGAAAC